MKYDLKKQYERGRNFLSSLKGNVSIIYHKDSDGLTSGVQVYKFFKRNNNNIDTISPNDKSGINISNELIETVKESDNVIFLDLPVDQISIVNKFEDVEVLVIDHHIVTKDLNDRNILHINPRFYKEDIYLPAAYLCYKIIGNKDLAWIAGIGVIGDYGVDSCRDLIEEIKVTYPGLLGEDLTEKAIFKSRLGLYSEMINASKSIRGLKGLNEAFRIISKCETPEEFIESRLLKYYEKFQKELDKVEDEFEERGVFYSKANSYVYEIESKYNISSPFSSRIAEKYPDSVIFIITRNKGTKLNVRCHSGRVNVGKFMSELTEGIGRGGGHPKAAGGKIPRRNTQEFLNRLEERLEIGDLKTQ